jgi:biopolymer transport protein ExbD
MKVRLTRKGGAEVQMGPMMDCVFLLLIFFIVIAVTKKSVKELQIELPVPGAAVSEVKPKDKDLVIRVTATGETWVGSQKVGKQGMLDAIRDAQKANPDTKVRFELDKRAQVQYLMPIWDNLVQYGLTNWGMRTTMREQ